MWSKVKRGSLFEGGGSTLLIHELSLDQWCTSPESSLHLTPANIDIPGVCIRFAAVTGFVPCIDRTAFEPAVLFPSSNAGFRRCCQHQAPQANQGIVEVVPLKHETQTDQFSEALVGVLVSSPANVGAH